MLNNKIHSQIIKKKSFLCVGLDIDINKIMYFFILCLFMINNCKYMYLSAFYFKLMMFKKFPCQKHL